MQPRQPAPGEHESYSSLAQKCPSCRQVFCDCIARRIRARRRLRFFLTVLAMLVSAAMVATGFLALADRSRTFRQVGLDIPHGEGF
jgi:hypothetical protein